jgi:predicted TIM-barrel fold metal-dependent hydrolase
MSLPMPAVDCHAHVFDLKRFPPPDSRGFDIAPNEHGTAADYAAVLDAHGMSHALLINPLGGYGLDNRYMLAAIAEHPGRFKGVALLSPQATDRDIKTLVDGGVVGIRFNLNFAKSPSLYGQAGERALAIARDVGWLVQVHYEGETIVAALPILRASRLTVVIDHFGRPQLAHGLHQPGFQALLELGRHGAVVKLSAGFRMPAERRPTGILIRRGPAAARLRHRPLFLGIGLAVPARAGARGLRSATRRLDPLGSRSSRSRAHLVE